MQRELERRRDAEIAAAAANRPKQIGMLLLACLQYPAACRESVRYLV
jgi:hypothetical protein